MPREIEDEEYVDDNEIEALHRFLSDQQTYKTVLNLVSIYMRAQHPDDDTVDDIEFPDIRRNDQILLMKSFFELMEEMVGGPVEDDDEFEDEEASVKKRRKQARRFLEIAKDKRMSAYYKAFMGDMRSLVGPWHSNRNKWLAMWMAMGMELYANSPSDEPDTKLKLVLKRVDDDSDHEEDTSGGEEEAAVIGGAAALPAKVARNITALGFEPIEAEEGDAAWAKSGKAEGFPDKQVVLVLSLIHI